MLEGPLYLFLKLGQLRSSERQDYDFLLRPRLCLLNDTSAKTLSPPKPPGGASFVDGVELGRKNVAWGSHSSTLY